MSANQQQHALIRPLEGYRALAILAVLIFHLDKSVLPGGYLGVDLFFVISGFIITKGLISAKQRNGLNLKTFYAKRFRRLFPALMVTALVTLLFAWIILDPFALAAMAKSAFFSIISLANINFWMESGYFDADSYTKPLLHMWSLSVEEQFYLFWPFVIFFVAMRNWMRLALVLLAFSFAGTIWCSFNYPETAFFWFPFRIYEFMGGALLAITAIQFRQRISIVTALLSGTAIFVLACLFFDEQTNIVIAGGTTVVAGILLIMSMSSALTERIYGNPAMVWIGQHSYSIYLVHWPLIVLFIAANGALTSVEKLLLGGTSFLLGAALKWLIEDPFRQSRNPRSLSARRAYPSIICATVLSLSAAVFIWVNQGFSEKLDVNLTDLLADSENEDAKSVRDRCFLTQRENFDDLPSDCYLPDPNRKNMLILGSSIAADLKTGMDVAFPDWNVLQVTGGGCPIFRAKSKNPTCTQMRNFIYDDLLNDHRFDLIVIAGFSAGAGATAAIENIQTYLEERSLDYVIIGPRPRLEEDPRKLISDHGMIEGLNEAIQSKFKRPKEIDMRNADKHYFSSVDAFCKTDDECVWQIEGRRIYRDTRHIYSNGSEYFAEAFANWYADRSP